MAHADSYLVRTLNSYSNPLLTKEDTEISSYGRIRNRIISIAGSTLAAFFRSQASYDELTDLKSIAVVKPCCIGDVLMATPTLGVLRAAFPAAQIDLYVGNWSKQMVFGNPNIDNIIDMGTVGSGRYRLNDYFAVVRQMRHGRYDACLLLDRSAFISLLPFVAGIPRRIGLDSQGRGFSLTTRVQCGEIKHEAELYLDVVRAIGIIPKNPRLEFYPLPKDQENAGRVLAQAGVYDTGVQQEKPEHLIAESPMVRPPVIVIHPGGGSNPGMDLLAKRWPAERFAAVADAAIAEFGATVLIVGGKEDHTLGRQMAAAMQTRATDLVGQTTLGELSAICQRADLFLGNDTGPMHLAVAVGATVIAIFGPTDERMYGPYAADATTITGRSSCRPCFQNGMAPVCAKPECITSVKVDAVWRATREKLLSKGFRANGTVASCLV